MISLVYTNHLKLEKYHISKYMANQYSCTVCYRLKRCTYGGEGWVMECLWFTLGVKFLNVLLCACMRWLEQPCLHISLFLWISVCTIFKSLLFMGMNATCWPQTWIDRRTYWCKPLCSLIIRFMLHYTFC